MSSRAYVDHPLCVGENVDLPKDVAHHLARVLRKRVGDALILFNGQGGEYPAVIESLSKSNVTVQVLSHESIERESPIAVSLVQGVSRGEKMDFTIQKAVELGVSHIQPITTQHGNVQLDQKRWAKKHEHWRKTIISACEQCGRNTLPTLAEPQSFSAFLEHCARDAFGLILDPRATQTVSSVFDQETDHSVKRIQFVIGPEGGLSPEEIAALQGAGFQGIQLGPRVLRTETAALAVIAMLQTQLGDFR